MTVTVYLHRVAVPLREFLSTVFGAVRMYLRPFKPEDIKVLVLDSVRGVTADYVHVVRGERFVGAQDQYWGIQSDLRREYISYTRGRLLCHVWLGTKPFGYPGGQPPRVPPSDRMAKGQDHAFERNRLIAHQKLDWNLLQGLSWKDAVG